MNAEERRERNRENNRKYREAHRGEINARAALHRVNKREDILKQNKAWVEKNREKYLAYKRGYHSKNLDRWVRYAHERRARMLEAGYEEFSVSDVLALHGTNCHNCGLEVDLTAPRMVGRDGWELGLHIDHVLPLASGGSHSLDNVKPSHGICNLSRPWKY